MIFCARRFIQVIAQFVVPVLTRTCGFVAASIPPKGGTTNTSLLLDYSRDFRQSLVPNRRSPAQ